MPELPEDIPVSTDYHLRRVDQLMRERDEARAEIEVLRAALHSACGDSWVDADAASAVYIKHARASASTAPENGGAS